MPSPQTGTVGTAVSPVSPTNPLQADQANAGSASSAQSDPASSPQAGQAGSAQQQSGGQQDQSQSQNQKQNQTPPTPTITAKWSKARVTPLHNNSFPPSSPPTDATTPDEAKVEMVVDTTNVPDGTSASITVCQCLFETAISNGQVSNLQVQGNRVIDPATGQRPVFVFTVDNNIYNPWDMELYYFQVQVDFSNLQATSEKNSSTNEAQCLRVMWYHMCVCDSIADTPAGGGLTTGDEATEIKGIIDAQKNHKATKQAFNQANVPVNLWGSVLRNTYCYHHASHGDIVDRTTNEQLNAGNDNPPTVDVGNWRSVIVLGSTNLGDAEIGQTDAVPSVPKYLAYLDTCVAGWEPSFGQAWISRGTQNVIAFRMYIPDGDARSMARNFHKKWIQTNNGDPTKISEIFFDVGASFYNSMRPILFGTGGGEIVSGGQSSNQLMSQISKSLGTPQ